MPQPIVKPGEVRCWSCGKMIAVSLGSGSTIDCRGCGQRNST